MDLNSCIWRFFFYWWGKKIKEACPLLSTYKENRFFSWWVDVFLCQYQIYFCGSPCPVNAVWRSYMVFLWCHSEFLGTNCKSQVNLKLFFFLCVSWNSFGQFLCCGLCEMKWLQQQTAFSHWAFTMHHSSWLYLALTNKDNIVEAVSDDSTASHNAPTSHLFTNSALCLHPMEA